MHGNKGSLFKNGWSFYLQIYSSQKWTTLSPQKVDDFKFTKVDDFKFTKGGQF